ncbi:MAG: hypothetical protein IPP69_18300 [Flavobacteriales bacterium]|nr:hypothetical protein [Flavobacteriales bacterium]
MYEDLVKKLESTPHSSKIFFEQKSDIILSQMLWQIADAYYAASEVDEDDVVFPDLYILDSLQAYDGRARTTVETALRNFCLNVMRVLDTYGILNQSLLGKFSSCRFINGDLAMV